MGNIKFDPISQPKRLKSRDEMRKLPENKKLVLEAGENKVRVQAEENEK